jgi:mono/diheme cytochrome c family protein
MVPERPPDPALEAATNRWLTAGLVIIALMVVAFPLYRVYEPAARSEARELHLASLAEQGSRLFDVNCSSCHGQEGLGGIAPALNSVQFLTAASDEQIASLIAVGVPGTQMSAYSLDHGGPLTLEQIHALTVYIRSLEPDAPDNPDWRGPLG